jgi:mannose/cellobiose epimerase-like protein (N-acyl-D-glucosamine 2-epimerase family)
LDKEPILYGRKMERVSKRLHLHTRQIYVYSCVR